MRLTAVAVVALLAVPPAAQSHLAPGAGAFVSLDALDPLRLGDGAVEVGVGAGWRFGNGLDAGVRVAAEHTLFDEAPERTVSEARRLAIAAEAGYTSWLATRTGLRFELRGALQQTVQLGAPTYIRTVQPGGGTAVMVIDRGNTDVNVGEAQVSVAAVRRVPLGRVALQPSVGVVLGGGVTAVADAEQPFTLRADAGRNTAVQNDAEALYGIEVGLPVLFEIAGSRLALDLRGTYDAAYRESAVRARLRVNL